MNDGVPKDKYLGSYFDLKYPSVDHIVDSLKELGTDALLYKIDIKRAFRHLRIDSGDLDLLGLKHDQYYIDGTLPFGFRHGSVFLQRCSDAIRFIMADTFGYPNLYNYIDDLVYTGLPGEIHQSYNTLLALLQDLGLEISSSKLIEPTHIAVCLGSLFIDKIKKIRDTFKYTRSQVLHPDKEPPTFCSFQAVTETEVLKFIKESPSKTCSLDPCPTYIVKQCIDILLPSLTKLVNLSLKNGIFPNPFKQAIVTPLLKKSTLSKEDLKSYRPVSGLSFLSKLVERIVAAQIRSHMDSHDLGNTFQSAYKVGHSTETALLCIKNEIHLSLSKGMPTALVLLDLSAAFDTIDHDTLLSCLSSRFGFAGSALKWFRSYLQDRFQSVKIGSSLSNLFKLKFGVPQGSVLGPLLFSLYTTPLGQVIRKYTGVRYHFYADDTQLFIHLSPDDSLKSFDRLKSCLNDIQVWMSENKLKLNPDKTEFIVFGAKDKHKWLSDSLPVNILGNCLSPADVVRNLGVLFDAKFCFTNHVNSVIKSCFISLRDLHRIRRFLSVDTSVVIANALVSSRLDYCNSLFCSLSSRNATRLQYVQNALARFVTGASKYTHITSTLRTLHWLPVRQRIIFKTLVLVYKYLTTGQPKYFAPYLPLYKSTVNTRRSNPKNLFLLVPSYCPSIHKSKVHFNNSFSYDAPKLWNDLPYDIRSAPNLSSFKSRLKTYLFQKSFPP